MKVIVDRHRQLNYNPLVVYVLADAKDYKRYSSLLTKMNTYPGFTRGLFKFHAIERGSSYCVSLGKELLGKFKRNNVIMRLADAPDGSFNYAIDNIDFSAGLDELETQVRCFVVDACNRSIQHIKSLLKRLKYNSEAVNLIDTLDSALQVYTRASLMKVYISWKTFLATAQIQKNNQADTPINLNVGWISIDMERMFSSISQELTSPENRENLNQIRAYIDTHMEAPSVEESNRLAEGTFDEAHSKVLVDDMERREEQKPLIKITIKQPSKENKGKQWGIEVDIDGTIVPVRITGTTDRVIYLGTLLKQKAGNVLLRRTFNEHQCSTKDKNWLTKLYRKVSDKELDFEDWYKKIQANDCHAVSQGKVNANNVIENQLSTYKGAVSMCSIQVNRKNGTSYFVEVPSENIIVPDKLSDLVSDAK